MSEMRPDPDALLERVKLEEGRTARGKLKIFLGAAPGVGKTYAMLQEARRLSARETDVALGYIEPHVRPETAALILGLDIIPPKVVEYRGLQLRELDLDACLRRKPKVLLVDELAHSNPPGSRHPKRWQDVEELLAAGIDVFTTLNVQHIESLKDIVASITGVMVRETVPDSFLDGADQIELVDIAPDDLIERFRSGNVYVSEEAERAMENFFRKENLIALRELSLRRAAERVGVELEGYRKSRLERPVWPIGDHLLVCVGPSPFSSRLVRATRRMAAGLKAPWVAAYVETPRSARLSQAAREQLTENLRLAQELGGEVVTLGGEEVVTELIDFARKRNVTKIVVGKPLQPRWKELLQGSLVYELTRRSGEIDVYVISGDAERAGRREGRVLKARWRPISYAWALAAVAVSTALGFLMVPSFALANIVMVYLLGVVVVAAACGERGPSVLVSVLSVVAFDFFFVPPKFSFGVSDLEYVFTFMVMLASGLIISDLTLRLRRQAEWARQRERATAALYAMSRTLLGTHGVEEMLREAARQLSSVFDAKVAVLLPDEEGNLKAADVGELGYEVDERERAVADWAFRHGENAGLGTSTLPLAAAHYHILSASSGPAGVIGLEPSEASTLLDPERLHLLDTFTNQVGLAIERARLATRARAVEMEVDIERLRNSLLSAVSHDLRTPLASIMGSSSTLLEKGDVLPPETRRELEEAIYDEAERLNRLVGNLLDVTRIEGGALSLRREWSSVEEIVGVVLARLSRSLEDHPVKTSIPSDLPLVPVDPVLVEQVLFNLVDNAIRHTPAGAGIDVSAERRPGEVIVSVADSGGGISPGEEARVFEKFQRAKRGEPGGGVGLGLTISKGIVTAHGGKIWVENCPDGGAVFRFGLPIVGDPPPVPEEGGLAPSQALPAGQGGQDRT